MLPLQKDIELIGTFSEIQKAAVINLLYKIGEADGKLSDAESLMIAKCNQVLKLNLHGEESSFINQMFNYSSDELIEILKPLAREQHEFIIRSVYDVHNVDMAIGKTELLIAICKGFSITAEELPSIVTPSNKPLSYNETPEYKRREAAGDVLFNYLDQFEKRGKVKNNSGCLGIMILIISVSSIFIYSLI